MTNISYLIKPMNEQVRLLNRIHDSIWGIKMLESEYSARFSIESDLSQLNEINKLQTEIKEDKNYLKSLLKKAVKS